jgi:hypothetical protein
MEYTFENVWRFKAEQTEVWRAIREVEQWPRWWPYVARVQPLAQGDPDGLDSLHRHLWNTPLPSTLEFDLQTTEIIAPMLLEGHASGGLEGFGRWTLVQQGAVTHVYHLWQVRISQPWMSLLAPLLGPVFAWNHHQVMRHGGQGLAKYLGVTLLQAESGRGKLTEVAL